MVVRPYYEYYINYNHSSTFSVVIKYINAQYIVTGSSIVIVYVLSKTRTLVVGLNTPFSLTRKAVKGTTIDLLITSDFCMLTQKPKFQKSSRYVRIISLYTI